MAPLDVFHPRSDAEVLRALETHLQIHDARFRGRNRAATRSRRRADAAAVKVLRWWEQTGSHQYRQGYGSAEQTAALKASAYSSAIGSVLLWVATFFVRRWVEKLVTDLLTDWLTSPYGACYRMACYGRRDP